MEKNLITRCGYKITMEEKYHEIRNKQQIQTKNSNSFKQLKRKLTYRKDVCWNKRKKIYKRHLILRFKIQVKYILK